MRKSPCNEPPAILKSKRGSIPEVIARINEPLFIANEKRTRISDITSKTLNILFKVIKCKLVFFTIYFINWNRVNEKIKERSGERSHEIELFQKKENELLVSRYMLRANKAPASAYNMEVHFVKKEIIQTDIADAIHTISTVSGLFRFAASFMLTTISEENNKAGKIAATRITGIYALLIAPEEDVDAIIIGISLIESQTARMTTTIITSKIISDVSFQCHNRK